eukprot:349883-Chlamydomonas_euryale.AAC.2
MPSGHARQNGPACCLWRVERATVGHSAVESLQSCMQPGPHPHLHARVHRGCADTPRHSIACMQPGPHTVAVHAAAGF